MNRLVEEVLEEGYNTSVLFHYTGIHSLLSILNTKEFHLTGISGADALEGYEDYRFYLSTQRSPLGSYGQGLRVCIVLDRDWLKSRYVVRPVDYWGRNFRLADPKRFEMEDRVFSKDRIMKLPSSPSQLIKEVHVAIGDMTDWPRMVRQALIETKKAKIALYVYDDVKDMKLIDRRRAISADKYIERLHGNEPFRNGRMSRPRGMNGWKNVIHATKLSDLNSDGKYVLRYFYGWSSDAKTQLSNEIHNNKREVAAQDLIDFVYDKGGIDAALAWIKEKWEKLGFLT